MSINQMNVELIYFHFYVAMGVCKVYATQYTWFNVRWHDLATLVII